MVKEINLDTERCGMKSTVNQSNWITGLSTHSLKQPGPVPSALNSKRFSLKASNDEKSWSHIIRGPELSLIYWQVTEDLRTFFDKGILEWFNIRHADSTQTFLWRFPWEGKLSMSKLETKPLVPLRISTVISNVSHSVRNCDKLLSSFFNQEWCMDHDHQIRLCRDPLIPVPWQ